MTRKPSAPVRFHRALRTAMELPAPEAIARRILQASPGAHNGLRAASYDGKVSGGTTTSHPERVAEERETARAGTELDHLRRLSKASEKAVNAVASLLGECADVGYDADDYDWDDALDDARRLTEVQHGTGDNHDPRNCNCLSLLEAAEQVARTIDTHVNRYADAVTDIRDIHERYTAKAATRWVQIREDGLNADEICDTCASLTPPVYVAARNKATLSCRHCNDLRLQAGERPPLEVKQAYHHGTQLDYRRALSHWDAWARGSTRVG